MLPKPRGYPHELSNTSITYKRLLFWETAKMGDLLQSCTIFAPKSLLKNQTHGRLRVALSVSCVWWTQWRNPSGKMDPWFSRGEGRGSVFLFKKGFQSFAHNFWIDHYICIIIDIYIHTCSYTEFFLKFSSMAFSNPWTWVTHSPEIRPLWIQQYWRTKSSRLKFCRDGFLKKKHTSSGPVL